MQRRLCLFLLLSALTAFSSASASSSPIQLRWFSATEGELRQLPIDVTAPPASDGSPVPLMADHWFKPLPDVEVPLLRGGSFSLRGEGLGSVVVLDLWATWCGPCRDELPHLQALHEELRDQGLKAFALNAQEAASIALPYAEALGLTMPLGSYGGELAEFLPFTQLPLVIIADRWGGMRARWDSYEPGYELKIAEVARELLAEKSPPAEKVAELLAGGDLLRTVWSRKTVGTVEGVAVVSGADGAGKILASVGRSLSLHAADGRTEEIWETALAPGLPRCSDSAAGEGYMVVAFRPGREELFILRMPEGKVERASSPAPVFDAMPLDSSTMLLATYEGLLEVSGGIEQAKRLEGLEGTISIRLLGQAEERRAIALELNGNLTWLDSSMKISERTAASPDGWRLLADERFPAEVGLLPMTVTAAVMGNFLKDRGVQAALATEDGQLLLVDPRSGSRLFHARWPGISDLAAGDLDGDGRDELVIGSGSRLSVLAEAAP